MNFDFKKYRQIPKISTSAVILAFFLPFITVKCGGTTIAEVSGVELVVGTKIGDKSDTDKGLTEVPPKLFAVLAFVCAIGATVLAWIKFEQNKLVPLIVAGVGLLSLILLYVTLDVKPNGGGGGKYDHLITIGLGFGYYLALIGFLTNTLFFGFQLKQDKVPEVVQPENEAIDQTDDII